MRELELLEQYLVRLRQERLQQAHAATLAATTRDDFVHVSNRAYEAELCLRVLDAVKDLRKDPGQFIAKHLQWREP